jgi:hypothetical protein
MYAMLILNLGVHRACQNGGSKIFKFVFLLRFLLCVEIKDNYI